MLRSIRESLKSQKGFTLVELLAVIAIIGVLAAIAVPRFTAYTDDAAAAKVMSDLKNIDVAIVSFRAVNPSTEPTTANLATYFQEGWPTPPAGWTGAANYTIVEEKTGEGAAAVGTGNYHAEYNGVSSANTLAEIKDAK